MASDSASLGSNPSPPASSQHQPDRPQGERQRKKNSGGSLLPPLLGLAGGLPSFPGIEQRGLQRPLLGSFRFGRGLLGSNLGLARRFPSGGLCRFLGCFLGRLASLALLLGGSPLGNSDLPGIDDRLSGRLALGKSRIV